MQTPGEQSVSPGRRLADFFGLKRNLVILLIAIFVIGAGEELWMRFVPKYLQAVGATVFVIGLYDALRTLLGAIYAYPGGVLVDVWGHRRAFLAFNLISILGYGLVLLIPHWGAVIAGMFLFLSWTCFSLPATFSLVGATLEANRHSMGVGIQSVIKRLPIMIAPVFGGMLIDRFGIIGGVRIALLLSIFLSALTILVQRQLREEPKREVAVDERWDFWRSLRERKALIIGYSDSYRRGQMVGAYYLVRDLIVSAGAILGAYLWKVGPAANFLGAATMGVVGTIFYAKAIRQSRQSFLNDLKNQLEMRRRRWK